MDEYLDQFMEDHINGGYGHILDQLAAEEYILDDEPVCPNCDDEGCDHCEDIDADPEDMHGDHDSTMTSIGWGTDEDYGCFGDDGFDDFGDW